MSGHFSENPGFQPVLAADKDELPLNVRVQFLDTKHLIQPGKEFDGLFLREGEWGGNFQGTEPAQLFPRLHHISIAEAAGSHAFAAPGTGAFFRLNAIQRMGREDVLQLIVAHLDFPVIGKGKAGENDPAAAVFHKTLRRVYGVFLRILYADGGVSVGNPGGRPQKNGCLILFRQFKRFLHHLISFRRRRRIQQRHLGKSGKGTRVLLGLGGNGAGIIRHKHHETALYADIFQAHEGIGSDIQAHLLHGDKGTGARVGGAAGELHGGFLIHGPFHIDTFSAAFRHGFQYLCGRRARIAADQADPRSERTEGDGLISHHEFFMHTVTSFSFAGRKPRGGFGMH